MKLEVEDDLSHISIRWKIEEPGGAGQESGRDPEGEPVRGEREIAAIPETAGKPDISYIPNMPEIPNTPEVPGTVDGPGEMAADM